MSASLRADTSEVTQMLNRLEREAPDLAQGAVDKSAKQLLDDLKNDWLNREGSGKTYRSRRGTSSGTHQASAPGEPPAPDTNTYRNSWQEEAETPDGLNRVVFTSDKRGPWLEFGTADMEPRPHATPAAIAHRLKHRNMVAKAIGELERRLT